MIKNYIKTAFRSLMKNKGFTFINVFGLALGLATCMLIVFYVFDELSYDKFNTNADRIYRVDNDIKFNGAPNSYAVAPAPMAAAMKNDFPEVEQAVRFRMRGGALVKKGNQDIHENKMVFVDSTLFSVFTLPMISGNPVNALANPHTIVITERIAQKYFNKTNVVGQVLVLNDTSLYKITGVIKNVPSQSHFDFDFFISMAGLAESKETVWLSNNFNSYVLLKPGTDYNSLEKKLPGFFRKHAGPQMETMLHSNFDKFEQAGNYVKLTLTPLTKIHLQSNRIAELGPPGNLQYVFIFSAIAIFILLIACVNFMNLSTARSSNRAREVGVRKVLGSPRKYLIAQFLTESVMLTLLASVIAVFAAWGLLHLFNDLSGKDLIVNKQLLYRFLPGLFVFAIVLGCLAGSYPALFLSGFNPTEVLKGKLSSGFKGGRLRSFLVVFQFAISIFLIIGTIVIYNQLTYIRSKDLGYNRDHILVVQNTWVLGNQAKAFKQEVKQLAGVQNATLTGYLPNEGNSNSTAFFKDKIADQKRAFSTEVWTVDEDYVNTLGIKMVAGRSFSKEMLTDSSGIIINESAARLLGLVNPVDKFLYAPADNFLKKLTEYHIIGVMKDFNFHSLRENVSPMVLVLNEERGALGVRITSANIPSIISKIEAKWKKISPNQQFGYSFMDDDFDAIYRSEQRVGTLALVFTSLAIIIACLGLFGLAAYAAEKRTKEIGIRKVLGANVSAIVGMLSKDFIILVFIAIAFATPLAWWAMHTWLQSFAYRQNIQWWVIALAGVTALLIAFITISFQSIKAALTNPVKSLRSE
jgi:putative ABC transport system permease protein